MPDPLVSVIVPCYNQGAFLHEALDSVQHQTYRNWECIIINDGSGDNTKEVATSYCERDARFRFLDQQNRGVSAARNLGLASSRGEFVQFLDGDDILEPGKLLLQVDFLNRHQSVDIVYGSTRYFKHGQFGNKFILNDSTTVPSVDVHYSDTAQAHALILRNISTICATLYRKRVFDAVKGFKEIIYEDWYFHIECSLAGKVFHFERIDGTCSFVRITQQSQMERHSKIHHKSPTAFPTAVNLLLKQYNYTSPVDVGPSHHVNPVRRIAKLMLPPVFVLLYRSLKNR